MKGLPFILRLGGSTVLMLLSRYFNRGSHSSLKSLNVRKFEGEEIQGHKSYWKLTYIDMVHESS